MFWIALQANLIFEIFKLLMWKIESNLKKKNENKEQMEYGIDSS